MYELTKNSQIIREGHIRVWYFKEYVTAMADAYTSDDVDVRGYMAWSLMDK